MKSRYLHRHRNRKEQQLFVRGLVLEETESLMAVRAAVLYRVHRQR